MNFPFTLDDAPRLSYRLLRLGLVFTLILTAAFPSALSWSTVHAQNEAEPTLTIRRNFP